MKVGLATTEAGGKGTTEPRLSIVDESQQDTPGGQ